MILIIFRILQGSYLVHYGSVFDERQKVGMTNNIIGWVNLVDSQGRIRWQANGLAKEEEVKSLLKCSHQLNASVLNRSTLSKNIV